MAFKRLILIVMTLFGGGAGTALAAGECADYDRITAQLGKKYGEQMLFTGFADTADKKTAAAIYEFWANPERGNWSLLAHKLLQLQIGGENVTKDCALIVNTGKRFHLSQIEAIGDRAIKDRGIETTAEAEDTGTLPPSMSSCVPHQFYARILQRKYQEVAVLHALTKTEDMLEIYGGKESWTIAQTRLQSSKNRLTGTVLRDEKTGQEIHQLCSMPAFSGKSWGLSSFVEDHI